MALFSSNVTPEPPLNRSLWTARLLCAVSLVLIAVWTWTGLQRELSPVAIRMVYQVSLLPALPFLISLALLFTSRKDLGLALLAGFGAAMLVGLAPLTYLMVLLSGFMSNRSEFIGLAMMVLMIPVQIALIAVSARTLYRLPKEARHPLVWPSGLALGVIYAGVAVALFYSLQSRYQQHGLDVAQQDRAAEQTVTEITRCAQAYRARHPEKGFPAQLSALGPGQEGCLSGGIVSGEDRGYRFTYVPGLPDAKGQIHLYSVVAQPAGYMETGSYFFASDESGHSAGAAGTLSGPAMTAPETWWNHSAGLVLGVKHCALLAASQQPAHGYPAVLADLGPSGTGCLTSGLIITQVDRHELRTHYQTVAYLGGPPDAQGRITTFAIYSRSNPNSVAFFTNESGVVHVHQGSGWASVRDPVWQPRSPDNSPVAPLQPSPPSDADMEQGCAGGRLADCLERGTRLLNQARLEEVQSPGFGRSGFTRPEAVVQVYRRAEGWFAKGCDGGLASACRALGLSYDDRRGADRDPLAAAPLFRKACDAGEALGCYDLGQVYEQGRAPKKQKTLTIATTPSGENATAITTWEDDWSNPAKTIKRDPVQAVVWYAKGCELDSDNACESAGGLFLRGEKIPKDTVKAAAMLQRLCDLSRATGCALLGELYASGNGVSRDEAQAAYLARKACVLGGGSLCEPRAPRS